MRSLARLAVVAVATTLAAASTAHAQSEGPNEVVNAATIVDDASIGSTPWNAPSQAATSDDVYANVNPGTGASHYLKAIGFGFSLDPTAIVLGIQVDVEKKAVGGTALDNGVLIVKGNVISGADHSDVNPWPAVDTDIVYGGASDLWGETWTPAEINAAGFGVAISMHDSISGVLAQVDAITITVFYALCGDGISTPPEQCDDGNTADGDCCDSTCQNEPALSPCEDDGLPCTADVCDGTGDCTHPTQPRNGCRTSQKSVLVYKDNADNTKDKLIWKWIKGQPTSFAELGLPTGTTAYTLCLYAGTTALGEATVPGDATKWKVIGANKGYKYKDKTAAEDGIKVVVLKASLLNKSKAIVKGKGDALPDLPSMPFTLPVTAQLVNSDNNVCLTSVFNAAKKNADGKFKAKSP